MEEPSQERIDEVNKLVIDGAGAVWPELMITDAIILGYGISESDGDRVVVYAGSDMHPWMYAGLLDWVSKRVEGRVGKNYDGQF